MKRTAKSRKAKQRQGLLAAGLAATGRAIAERPVGVGGFTAFAVTFAFVAANAIWYQPHQHASAFFQTRNLAPREPAEPVDVTRLELAPALDLPEQAMQPTPVERPQAMQPMPQPTGGVPDARAAVIAEVQRELAALKLYGGQIDGMTGPQTDAAVTAYRERLGLAPEGGIDAELLGRMGAKSGGAKAEAAERAARAATDQMQTASAPPANDAQVLRIQAGLRAFGNEGIDLDGRIGPRTVAAIKEFQGLFDLPETGSPDQATYLKMKEIGLTD